MSGDLSKALGLANIAEEAAKMRAESERERKRREEQESERLTSRMFSSVGMDLLAGLPTTKPETQEELVAWSASMLMATDAERDALYALARGELGRWAGLLSVAYPQEQRFIQLAFDQAVPQETVHRYSHVRQEVTFSIFGEQFGICGGYGQPATWSGGKTPSQELQIAVRVYLSLKIGGGMAQRAFQVQDLALGLSDWMED